MRISKFISLFIFSGIMIGSQGAEFKAGETVEFSGPVKEDFYSGGGRVNVTSDVTGDVVIAGGEINYKGKMTGDALITGGKVTAEISGGDDIRIIGGEVDLTSKITGDVFVAGGDVNITSQSVIRGDLYIAGGKVTLDGQVLGNVVVYTGDFNFNGKIGKNLSLQSENSRLAGAIDGVSKISSRNITVQPTARFKGQIDYWSEKETSFNNAPAVYKEELKGERDYNHCANAWPWFVFWFLGYALLTIFLIVFFMPKLISESGSKLLTNPASSLGYGVMYYLITPAIAIFLMMSVLGIVHGLLVGVLYGFSFAFAGPLTAIVILKALVEKYKKDFSAVKTIFASLGIYFIMLLLMSLPGIGFLLNMLITGASTGSFVMALIERKKQK